MADEWGNPISDMESVSIVDPAEPVIGTYRGFRIVNGDYGPSKLHRVENDAGELLGVWGTGVLDYHIDGHDGHRVKIVKTGDKINTKAGRAWEFKIWCATCQGTAPARPHAQAKPETQQAELMPPPPDEEPPF